MTAGDTSSSLVLFSYLKPETFCCETDAARQCSTSYDCRLLTLTPGWDLNVSTESALPARLEDTWRNLRILFFEGWICTYANVFY